MELHLKLLDVLLQILVIHQLSLKLHPLLIDAPSAFYHPILPKECMLGQLGDHSINGDDITDNRVSALVIAMSYLAS